MTPNQIRVRSRFGAASNATEMALYKGYGGERGGLDPELLVFSHERALFRYPVALGNICVGVVTEVGADVSQAEIGDTVFKSAPFREEHVWPESVRHLPDGVAWQAAVCLDPVDFALGAVRDGHVRIGDAVAVFGMGQSG
ncbi:MAG: hypothetical protein HC802_10360 [Caldilineaceae bacterium]|nr:hypothetical protein [Caldilineaceae bacterium]